MNNAIYIFKKHFKGEKRFFSIYFILFTVIELLSIIFFITQKEYRGLIITTLSLSGIVISFLFNLIETTRTYNTLVENGLNAFSGMLIREFPLRGNSTSYEYIVKNTDTGEEVRCSFVDRLNNSAKTSRVPITDNIYTFYYVTMRKTTLVYCSELDAAKSI